MQVMPASGEVVPEKVVVQEKVVGGMEVRT